MSLLFGVTEAEYDAQARKVARMGVFLSSTKAMMLTPSQWDTAHQRYLAGRNRLIEMRDEIRGSNSEVKP